MGAIATPRFCALTLAWEKLISALLILRAAARADLSRNTKGCEFL
jgi:hypothetical protein